eukprot:UN03264
MSLISRLSRLSYGNRLITRPSFVQNSLTKPTLCFSPLRRFAHGPPTKIGMPHSYGGMKWFPCKGLLILVLVIQYQMFGLILWYKWDTITYPSYRYQDENTTARNW